MPGFSFTTIEPNQIGQVTKWDVPINDWLGLKFGSGQNDTLGHQFRNRVEDDIYDDKTEASVDVLNRAYGIDDRLKFTEPMSIQRARLINERKRKEIESQSYFESASHSWFSGKAAAGFGAAMVGSLSHPLDIGLSFLPFVGSEKAVAGVARMGGGQLERMMARGLITEERLAAIGVPLPRLSGAMIDGAVNQLAMEVPIAFQKNRDMANYDSSDFAFNVLAGGVFAGGVKSISLAFERAAKAWTSLDPKIRDAAPLKALREIFTREPAGFDADVKLDEATIRAQVTERVRAENPFDEAAVRAGYDKIVAETADMFGRTLPDLPQHRAIEVARMTAKEAAGKFQAAVEAAKGHGRKGSDPSLLSDIDYATALLWRINSGRGEPIIRYESKTAKVGEIFEDAGLTYRVSSVKDGQVVAIQTGSERFSQMYSPELEVIAQKEARGIELTPEEYEKIVDLIDPETPNAHSDFMQRVSQLEDELEIPKLMEEQRRLNLEEYVAQKRAEYDARVKDVADAETKKATENIRKQAKSPLTPEEVQKYTVKAPADDAAIKLVEDEADELIKTVLDSVDSVEDRARLEAEINAELERHGFKTEKKGKEGGTADVLEPLKTKADATKVEQGGTAAVVEVIKVKWTNVESDNPRAAEWGNEFATTALTLPKGREAAVKSASELTGKTIFDVGNSSDKELAASLRAIVGKPGEIPHKNIVIGHGTGDGPDWRFVGGDKVQKVVDDLTDGEGAFVIACETLKERNFATAEGVFVSPTKPPEVGVSAEKAIDTMIPCVIAKAKL